MKWNETILDALGGIDDDLIPPSDCGKPDSGESASGESASGETDGDRKTRSRLLRIGSAAAAVLAVFGIGRALLFPPALPRPDGAGEAVPGADEREIPFYLGRSAPEDYPSVERVTPLFSVDASENDDPLVFPVEDPYDAVLPASPVFTDGEGRLWRMVSPADHSEDPLLKSLRLDAEFANVSRSYGCVLWEADWNAGMAVFLGVVPLLPEEGTRTRLMGGDYITPVPEEEIPEITEEKIGRRTTVYLASPSEDRIRIYDSYFVRLEKENDEPIRWGLFFVRAAESEPEIIATNVDLSDEPGATVEVANEEQAATVAVLADEGINAVGNPLEYEEVASSEKRFSTIGVAGGAIGGLFVAITLTVAIWDDYRRHKNRAIDAAFAERDFLEEDEIDLPISQWKLPKPVSTFSAKNRSTPPLQKSSKLKRL